MPKQVMTRQASDNVYLHKDFHGGLSGGIEYIHEQYGAEAVREYLRQFAGAFYAPLKKDLARREDRARLLAKRGCIRSAIRRIWAGVGTGIPNKLP